MYDDNRLGGLDDPDFPEWDELTRVFLRWKVRMELQRISMQQAPIDPIEAANNLRRAISLLSSKLN